jgi:hypothetical protein
VKARLREWPRWRRRLRSHGAEENRQRPLLTLDNQIDTTTGTVKATGAVRQQERCAVSRTSSST